MFETVYLCVANVLDTLITLRTCWSDTDMYMGVFQTERPIEQTQFNYYFLKSVSVNMTR